MRPTWWSNSAATAIESDGLPSGEPTGARLAGGICGRSGLVTATPHPFPGPYRQPSAKCLPLLTKEGPPLLPLPRPPPNGRGSAPVRAGFLRSNLRTSVPASHLFRFPLSCLLYEFIPGSRSLAGIGFLFLGGAGDIHCLFRAMSTWEAGAFRATQATGRGHWAWRWAWNPFPSPCLT